MNDQKGSVRMQKKSDNQTSLDTHFLSYLSNIYPASNTEIKTECDTHSPNEATYQESNGYHMQDKLQNSSLELSPEPQYPSHLWQPQHLANASMASMAYSQPSIQANKAPTNSGNMISLSAPNMDHINPVMRRPEYYGASNIGIKTECELSSEPQYPSHLSQPQHFSHTSMASMAYSQPTIQANKAPTNPGNMISLSTQNMDHNNPVMGHSENYGAGNPRSRRRQRTTFNSTQLAVLETLFKNQKCPGISERNEVARKIQLPEDRVQVWFKNRRAKCKKEQKEKGEKAKPSTLNMSPFSSSSFGFCKPLVVNSSVTNGTLDTGSSYWNSASVNDGMNRNNCMHRGSYPTVGNTQPAAYPDQNYSNYFQAGNTPRY